jgi:hypothetical protein
MSSKKTYTTKEVNTLLREQRKISAIIPLLMLSRGRHDWREWNKEMRSISNAIKGLPLVTKHKNNK